MSGGVALRRWSVSTLAAKAPQTRTLATHASPPEKDCSSITPPYSQLQRKLALVRQVLGGRPLTLAEKILYSHITDPAKVDGGLKRGETYLQLSPERVAMQDASAQYALDGLTY
ncbi:hypothetical protein AcW2_001049 [Taiwanofungus camphoratus]|nr:hypothetical protein AcW2_001049 [Antrodia cinnamomea]